MIKSRRTMLHGCGMSRPFCRDCNLGMCRPEHILASFCYVCGHPRPLQNLQTRSTPREVLCRCCLHVKLSLGHHHDHAVAADAAPMTMQRTSSNLRSVHCPASLKTPGRSAAGSQPSCKQRTLGFMAIGYGGHRLAGC